MSQLQSLTDQTQLLTTKLLPSEWTLWFSYSCDSQNGINYNNNLMQVQKVRTWNEFMLLWKWACRTDNFFINPEDGSFKKYKFGPQQRKVDSINFFKEDIQPQWEFGDNPKYGYFNFGIERANQNTNLIFQASVFMGVGQSQEWAKEIFGMRIVDLSAKPTHPSRARVEIWVKFRHDNSKESLERLLFYQDQLKKYYKESIGQEVGQLRFFNISNGDEELKTPKKQYIKKSESCYNSSKKPDKNKY